MVGSPQDSSWTPTHFSVFPLTSPERDQPEQEKAEFEPSSERFPLSHPEESLPSRHSVSATGYSWPPHQPLTERGGLLYGKTQTLW